MRQLFSKKPLFSIDADEIRTGVGLIRQYLYIIKPHITGMAHEEALGRQIAPHRGLGIFLLLLILHGLIDLSQFTFRHTTFMMDGDVPQPDILHGVTWQAGD